MNLIYMDKIPLSTPGREDRILSTHREFSVFLLRSLGDVKFNNFYGGTYKSIDRGRSFFSAAVNWLATGASQSIFDVPLFVLETYKLKNLFDVCKVYETYVQGDLSFFFNEHSILIDGFNYVFRKILSKTLEGMNRAEVQSFIWMHRKKFLAVQDFLVPLMFKEMMSADQKSESLFFFDLFEVFYDERETLSAVHKILFKYVHMEDKGVEVSFDYNALSSFILSDYEGAFFPFCYNLDSRSAVKLEETLRRMYPPLPYAQPTLERSGVWRNRLAIQRSAIREKVKPYVQKLEDYNLKIMTKRDEMSRYMPTMKGFKEIFRDVLKEHFPLLRPEDIDERRIKVNGRSVSFEIDGKEVIIKVRKKGEDMRDHAIIAQGLDDDDHDIKEQYASAHYVRLSSDFGRYVHGILCDKERNPKIKFGKEDLEYEAAVIVIRHTRYFDYITQKGTSFFDFKTGLKKAMEQSFRQAHKGRFMSSITDLAHDKKRPALFFIVARFLGVMNGVHLGTFGNVSASCQTLDVSPYGLRDLGNILTLNVPGMENALSTIYKHFLEKYKVQFIIDGKGQDFYEDSLLIGIQESLSMTITSGILLILSRLQHDDDMRNQMNFEKFLELIEEIVIQPFCDAFLDRKHASYLTKYYYDVWRDDFNDFMENPNLLDKSIMIGRREDVGRDFPFQALHIFSSFLLSSLPSSQDLDLFRVRGEERTFHRLTKMRDFSYGMRFSFFA